MAVSRINEAGLNVNQFGNRNLIINGAMLIDQRNGGASVTVSNGVDTFCPDRFRFTENHSGTFTIEQVSDAPVGFEKSSKITVTGTDSSLSAGEFARILQGIEGQNITHLNWGSANAKTCTLTFYVKSSVTGQYYISINNNATNRNMLKGYTIDAANTWEKKEIEIIGDTTGTWLTTNAVGIYIMWTLGTGSTYQSSTTDAYQAGFYMGKSDQINLAATSSATWQLTGVQLEVGDTATDFEHRTFGDELAKCQRYYQVLANAQSDAVGLCFKYNSSNTFCFADLPVEMREQPTVEQNGASGDIRITMSGSNNSFSSCTLDGDSSPRRVRLNTSTVVSGASSGAAGWWRIQNSGGFVNLDAEL